MVFSSIPVYLDPPNWHQQHNHHRLGSSGNEAPHQLPPHQQCQLPPPQPSHVGRSGGGGGGGGSGLGSIRPGSMSDRARMAKIPQPEAALKCPRCESSNTKFCYFNNYSLTQPRHFCKTCRRYWTRGGALRNVPVGGGCRRNKKTKTTTTNRNRSKSPVPTEMGGGSGPNSTTLNINPSALALQSNPFPLSIPNHLSRNLGLNFGEIQVPGDLGFQVGNNAILAGEAENQWRLQQFPGLMGFESYPFQVTEGVGAMVGDTSSTTQLITNLPSSTSRVSPPQVKMEDNHHHHHHHQHQQGLNLSSSSRPSLTISDTINHNHNNQFWGGNPWTDLSGGLNSSSSTAHLL